MFKPRAAEADLKEYAGGTEARLAEALKGLADVFDDRVAGIRFRGLSLSKSPSGGWLAVCRTTITDVPDGDPAKLGGHRPGPYVTFGFGDSPLEAIAMLDSKLVHDEATLSPDKWAEVPSPSTGRSKRR